MKMNLHASINGNYSTNATIVQSTPGGQGWRQIGRSYVTPIGGQAKPLPPDRASKPGWAALAAPSAASLRPSTSGRPPMPPAARPASAFPAPNQEIPRAFASPSQQQIQTAMGAVGCLPTLPHAIHPQAAAAGCLISAPHAVYPMPPPHIFATPALQYHPSGLQYAVPMAQCHPQFAAAMIGACLASQGESSSAHVCARAAASSSPQPQAVALAAGSTAARPGEATSQAKAAGKKAASGSKRKSAAKKKTLGKKRRVLVSRPPTGRKKKSERRYTEEEFRRMLRGTFDGTYCSAAEAAREFEYPSAARSLNRYRKQIVEMAELKRSTPEQTLEAQLEWVNELELLPLGNPNLHKKKKKKPAAQLKVRCARKYNQDEFRLMLRGVIDGTYSGATEAARHFGFPSASRSLLRYRKQIVEKEELKRDTPEATMEARLAYVDALKLLPLGNPNGWKHSKAAAAASKATATATTLPIVSATAILPLLQG